MGLPWFAWVAIVAVVSGSVNALVQSWFRHHERMAMIRQGMNPDVIEKTLIEHEL